MPTADNAGKPGASGILGRFLPAALLLVTVVFVAAVRWRLLQVPLERDEGEYAYVAQLLLGGYPPYAFAYSLKLPGTFFAYAFFLQAFGQSIEGIRVGLLLLNLVAIVFLFLIARDLCGETAGIAASASYAVLSLGPSVLGIYSHATHFVMAFVLPGLWIFLRTFRGDRPPVHYLLSGLLLGTGFTMKQHAAFFVAFPVLYLFVAGRMKDVPRKTTFLRSGCYSIGAAIPFAAICVYLYAAGVFDRFWFWTFDYAREYVSEIPVGAGLGSLVSQTLNVARPSLLLWLLAVAGIFSLFAEKPSREDRLFVSGFLAVSVLAICPGFYFREHYYILLLPAICLLIGASVQTMRGHVERRGSRSLSLVLSSLAFLAAMAQALYHDKGYYFTDPAETVGRYMSGGNPFPESPAIAKYIEGSTSPSDRILVLGSEPQIYFYSRRISATGHIYMYGLMENQKYARSMQREMMKEIVSADPEFIVVVTAPTSWLISPVSDTSIVEWANRYAAEKFELVGVADKISIDRTNFLWHRDALGYLPQSESVIYLFKKRRSA